MFSWKYKLITDVCLRSEEASVDISDGNIIITAA